MERAKPGSLTAKWKEASKKTVKAIEPKLPKKQDEGTRNGPSLVFFKEKAPVTFQLSRSKNQKDFELMSFVNKARDEASNNPVKAVIHVEQTKSGSRLVACDSIRLHAAEISKKIKSGDYRAHVTKDTIMLGEPEKGIKYFPWLKIIPEDVKKRGEINLEKSGLGKNREETENLSLAFDSIVKQTGKTVNLRDLDDLAKGGWTVYSRDEDSRIVLRQQSKKGEAGYPVAVIVSINKAA
jgi:hypothetical protein